MHSQFAQDCLDVQFDRTVRDIQMTRDDLVALPLREMAENLVLTGRQTAERRQIIFSLTPVSVPHKIRQDTGQRGRDNNLPRNNLLKRENKLIGGGKNFDGGTRSWTWRERLE